MELYVENEQEKLQVEKRTIDALHKAMNIASNLHSLEDSTVNIILVDNAKIREINREYRGVDRETDVISFALNDFEVTFPWEREELGDIYISVEKALEQSREYGHSFDRELVYLAVHGLLHLLGYDHLEEAEKKEMRQEEEKIMAEVGLLRE
ncbi:MAG: rRNA maturation RNase YbeY [Bacillota bacterium]|jgi:probable rRNA maturation factor|nr:rRNA maturation RNase YbeY [Bacillota bacterium]NLU54208.1 rRNA maturation RNase YbeY [Bacillota bacterium]HOA90932.1 rRNA maturation RNase YbeY [Bacillota bacterium]HOJ46034.1 rRNA maturation RNase YbeY [Bacillota bacterium]HOL14123.1 rRNA maturation RNase YbeY [Bacillota bacterium]